MIFANCGPTADQRKHKKKETCDLKPQDMKDPPNALEGHTAGAIKSPNPAIFASLSPRYPQKGASLGTKIAGWQV